ncbi:ubiquitin conjugating enzyme (UbcB) [Venturia nashicola]|uniref:E2 ubiquitin-conjugating enzyme n=1 Tax=Venturia nashicola TaxID=86259 RepID=A0A4Z1P7F8_9PEZI|nr:ubiquitin conjugating enzyme (UbcB) [Venturia nashicola]TLD37360.1 ubiquitin conjugating enzyme (UbcB) [Venturia nashicola]
MAGSTKRIQKELAECMQNPPAGVKVKLIDDNDLHKWEILMDGPEQSAYAGGHFTLHLTLPNNYPFKPPVLNFATKIYHPNISNDEKGSMCLGMLRADEWKPPNRVLAVLELARSLLIEPLPDDAIESSIAEQYKNKRSEWEKEARSWTKRYAGGN